MAQTGFCNYDARNQQTIFKTKIENGLSLRVEAVVDKNFAKSIIASDVQPSTLANNPQTHFAKLRLNKNYNFTHNGHYVSGAVNQTFTW